MVLDRDYFWGGLGFKIFICFLGGGLRRLSGFGVTKHALCQGLRKLHHTISAS